MAWITTNITGGVATKAWADETRAAIGTGAAVATSTTNGITGRTLTVDDQGGTAYLVLITFQTASPGNIGEVSVINTSATSCVVYNTGNEGIAFSYKVFK